jgi:hypothetical protein
MKNSVMILVGALVLTLYACRGTLSNSSSVPSTNNYSTIGVKDSTSQLTDQNNLILTSSENTDHAERASMKIVIEGENNILEIIEKNARVLGSSDDVVGIKGNGNIIRLISADLIDERQYSQDTLVFLGDNKKYVLDTRNKFLLPARNYKVKNVVLTDASAPMSFDPSRFIQDGEQQITLAYFDTLVTARFAVDYLTTRLPTGEPAAYFELGEMFLYGIGVEASPSKGVELLEFSAAKNHIPSIIRLGDIYADGSFGYRKDKNKTSFYYKKCSALGDASCTEKLLLIK